MATKASSVASDAQSAYWAAVASDFKVFLMQAFTTLYPGTDFMDAWYIDAIVDALARCRRGELPRLIVNLPPRHLKSSIVTIAWPAYLLARDPTVRIVCVSYSDDLARAFAREFRRILDSAWYRRLFPQVVITKSTEGETVTHHGGSRYAVSVGGTLTGRGADIIVVDDPLKPEEALSDRLRASNNEWFRNTLFSRLDDKQRSGLVVVMQRLHVNDLTGYLEGSGGFHKLSLPAIALGDEDIRVGDNECYRRYRGEALNPDREPVTVLERIRADIGQANFMAQYQQAPEAPEGALFKSKYIRFVERAPPQRGRGLHWISIDTALATSPTADYSAITVGYSDRTGHYVRAAVRGRFDLEDLLAKSLHLREQLPTAQFIIEAAGAGISLIQALRRRGIPALHYRAEYDKLTRAAYVLPVFAEGRVAFVNVPGRNEWVQPFMNELLSFPNGRYDDQVDSLVQAIRWAERRVRPYRSVVDEQGVTAFW